MNRLVNWWLICGWLAVASSVFAASQTDSVTVGYSSFAGAYGPLWISVEEQLGRKHGLELKATQNPAAPAPCQRRGFVCRRHGNWSTELAYFGRKGSSDYFDLYQ